MPDTTVAIIGAGIGGVYLAAELGRLGCKLRLHDLDDLANRLMRVLMGQDHAPGKERLPENAILVARSMGPAALLDYDRRRLRGLLVGGRRRA